MAIVERDARGRTLARARPRRGERGADTLIARQHPTVIWMTGRSGAGKSTISAILEHGLRARGHAVGTVDGDNLRHGLCRDLGFTQADRDENVRRAAQVAELMARSGLIVLVSLISPFGAGRAAARELFDPDAFFEVYVEASLEVAEWRDPKGLYRRARAGEIPHFTGIDSPYEPPRSPELRLDTVRCGPQECAQQVLAALLNAGRLCD